MKLFFRYFREAIRLFPKAFAAAMGMTALLTLTDTVMPWGMRAFLDRVIEEKDYGILWGGCAIFAVFLFVQTLLNIRRFAALDRFGGAYIEHLTWSWKTPLRTRPIPKLKSFSPR